MWVASFLRLILASRYQVGEWPIEVFPHIQTQDLASWSVWFGWPIWLICLVCLDGLDFAARDAFGVPRIWDFLARDAFLARIWDFLARIWDFLVWLADLADLADLSGIGWDWFGTPEIAFWTPEIVVWTPKSGKASLATNLVRKWKKWSDFRKFRETL